MLKHGRWPTSLPRSPASGRRRAARGHVLGRAFALLVALTTALIVLGALVRAHGAGLACPDWPLCFGTLVPRMNLEVAFEWSHRLVAGSMSLGFVALAAATARDAALRARVGLLLAVGCGCSLCRFCSARSPSGICSRAGR